MATGVGGDFCTERGFKDGAQRNDAGQLVAECHAGPTPNGGAYSIVRYLAAGRPAHKDEATAVEITEFDAAGTVVGTTHGTIEDK